MKLASYFYVLFIIFNITFSTIIHDTLDDPKSHSEQYTLDTLQENVQSTFKGTNLGFQQNQNPEKMFKQNTYDTIVVGSGIAGMSAAHYLAEQGKKVLVLQVNDYIGGRMKTTPVKLANQGEFLFEKGANWIHGSSKKNPITLLSKQISGIILIQTNDQSISVYDQSGKSADKLVDKEWDDYEKILGKVESMENLTTYEAIKRIKSQKLQNKYFMYNIANDVEFQTSSSIQDLSAEYGQDDQEIQGTQMLVVSGYQRFVQHLSKNSNIQILLNHKVIEIKNNGTSSTVKCLNEHIYEATNIVIAVPIGVLKNKVIKFVPELPNWKNQAISKLQFGNVCKILIVLKNQFSVEDKQHYFGVVANDVEQRGSATYFLNIQGLTKLNALMTFGLGPNSNELQSMPQPQLKQLIAERLKIIVDKDIISNDFDIVRSSWRSQQNFGGAYTYSGVNTFPIHWKNMAKPIFDNKWYFCGQHTYSKFRGTVHGAYLSGKTVGQSIIDNITEKNWKYVGKSEQ